MATLNNKQELIKMAIESVLIHWSESGIVNEAFSEEETVTDLNKLSAIFDKAGEAVGTGQGYDKTKLTVKFRNGDEIQCRLDLSAEEKCLFQLMEHYLF